MAMLNNQMVCPKLADDMPCSAQPQLRHVTDTGDVAVPAAPGDLLDPMETMQVNLKDE